MSTIVWFVSITALDYEEETEAVLKEFIKTELEISDADQINFQNCVQWSRSRFKMVAVSGHSFSIGP
jgi:hypothetical protein